MIFGKKYGTLKIATVGTAGVLVISTFCAEILGFALGKDIKDAKKTLEALE